VILWAAGSAQGVAPPGLPQIRTCPTKAYGSSRHGFTPGGAIRSRFVNRPLRLGVLDLLPDYGSVTRPSLPSAGSSPGEVPDFRGTMEDSDSCRPVSPDSGAARRYPRCAWGFAPALPRRRQSGPGGCGSAPPRANTWTGESGRSLRLLGNPAGRSPCSWTPAGPGCQAIAAPGHGPSARSGGGHAARSLISGLDSTAFALAVYASSARSPGPTQDALLAVGQLYQVGLVTHRVPTKGFRLLFLLSQPIRTQERPSSAALGARIGVNRGRRQGPQRPQ